MDKWFNSKWFVRAVSLAFAILIYVFVNIEVTTTQSEPRIPSASNEVRTLNDVPVDIRIDSDNYVVSGVPEYVTVSLEGATTFLTSTIMQKNFEVFVDLRGLPEGPHTVDIEYVGIRDELSVYIEPKTIEVRIEERASKEFPVTVDFINKDQLPIGYELGEPVINPGTVTIISSRSVIDQIAMVKAYIDVAGLKESVKNREVPVNVYDSQGNGLNVRIEPATAVVSVNVEKPSKRVPIQVPTTGALPDGLKLISAEAEIKDIEVFATKATLAGIDYVTTEEIDLSQIKKSGEFEAKLILPDGSIVNNENIKVIIEVEQTKAFENISIQVDKLDNQNYEFINPNKPIINVIAVGNEKDVSQLAVDDIKVIVDIKDLDVGEHQVPILIQGPDHMTFSSELEKTTIQIK